MLFVVSDGPRVGVVVQIKIPLIALGVLGVKSQFVSASHPPSCYCALWETADDGFSAWLPSTCVGDLGGFWLQLGAALAIWGNKPADESFSVSLSLCVVPSFK